MNRSVELGNEPSWNTEYERSDLDHKSNHISEMKAAAVSILLALSCLLLASSTPDPSSAVIRDWTQEHLRVIAATLPFLSPPAIARSLAVVNSCIFDALGAYVPTWKSAYCSVEKRPLDERTLDNMNKTVAVAGE